MTKTIQKLILTAMLLFASLFSTNSDVAAAPNASIQNGDYQWGWLGWWGIYRTNSTARIEITTDGYNSNLAGRLYPNGSYAVMYQDMGDLQPNTYYKITAWIKTSDNSTANIALYANGTTQPCSTGISSASSNGFWTKLDCEVITPATVGYAFVFIGSSAPGSNWVTVDNWTFGTIFQTPRRCAGGGTYWNGDPSSPDKYGCSYVQAYPFVNANMDNVITARYFTGSNGGNSCQRDYYGTQFCSQWRMRAIKEWSYGSNWYVANYLGPTGWFNNIWPTNSWFNWTGDTTRAFNTIVEFNREVQSPAYSDSTGKSLMLYSWCTEHEWHYITYNNSFYTANDPCS